MTKWEAPDNLFLVDKGQVSALLERPDQPPIRLETMGSGHVVGELGFYLDQVQAASVIADTDCSLCRITRRQLIRLEKEEAAIASTLHHVMVYLLAERVTHLVSTVNALQI